MKVQIRINTGFVSEGGRGSVWKTVNLNKEQVEEFDLKRRTLDEEKNLEEFIVEDIQDLVQNEIDNGLYGMFNYQTVDFKLRSQDNGCIFSKEYINGK